MADSSKYRTSTISFTLPLSCQICLGKVKQPCVCPNQHVFCSSCMDIWLQRNHMCPSCRVPITTETPCKQILGGPILPEEDNFKENVDLKVTLELRRSRVTAILQEYEEEVQQLREKIETLHAKNKCFQVQLDAIRVDKKCGDTKVPSSSTKQDDVRVYDNAKDEVLARLNGKLQVASATTEKVKYEMSKLKEINKKLRDENFTLSMENGRLKHSLTIKSPKKFEKYAQAAQKSHLDQCQKEIKQLKKALDRSDNYIEEQGRCLAAYQSKFGVVNMDTKAYRVSKIGSLESDKESNFEKLSTMDTRIYEGESVKSWKNCDKYVHERGKCVGEFCGGEWLRQWRDSSPQGNSHEGNLENNLNNESDSDTKSNGPSPAKRRLVWDEDKIPVTTFDSESAKTHDCHLKNLKYHSIEFTPTKQVKSSETFHQGVSHHKTDNVFAERHWEETSFEKPSPSTPSSYIGRLSLDCDTSCSDDNAVGGGSFGATSKNDKPRRSGSLPLPARVKRSLQKREYRSIERSKGGFLHKSMLDQSKDRRTVEDTGLVPRSAQFTNDGIDPNSTIGHLDFTLTPEFVDCAKLLKEAELRVLKKGADGDYSGANSPDVLPVKSNITLWSKEAGLDSREESLGQSSKMVRSVREEAKGKGVTDDAEKSL